MSRERVLLLAIRVGLPVALALAGIILVIVGHGGGHPIADAGGDTSVPVGGTGTTTAVGVVLIGLGLLTWMINWLYRATNSSTADRDVAERARDYFTEHGHGPGEGGR